MDQQRYLYDQYLHHGGVAADINMPGGYSGSTYRWLQSHARAYGFVNDVGGEPWRWTYRG